MVRMKLWKGCVARLEQIFSAVAVRILLVSEVG